jgi:hypothetical protein
MASVIIENAVEFSATNGVTVYRDALEFTADKLQHLIAIAFSHLEDEIMHMACHGGDGPLANIYGVDYQDYLRIKEAYRVHKATLTAKKIHTAKRRKEFAASRSQLVLWLIESGVPYVCNWPQACGETEDLTVDHKTPVSRGGGDEFSNLQFLCKKHNSMKGDKLLWAE